jgi:transposase-like protein
MDRTERTAKKREAFLTALSDGLSVAAGCQAAGIGRTQVYQWRKDDPDFENAWDAALEVGTDLLEDEAKRRAMSTSDVLMIFLLKARRKEKYADLSKMRYTGKDDDTPIKLDVTEEGRQSIDEFMAEFVAKRADDA